jgi:hypothetical protein
VHAWGGEAAHRTQGAGGGYVEHPLTSRLDLECRGREEKEENVGCIGVVGQLETQKAEGIQIQGYELGSYERRFCAMIKSYLCVQLSTAGIFAIGRSVRRMFSFIAGTVLDGSELLMYSVPELGMELSAKLEG